MAATQSQAVAWLDRHADQQDTALVDFFLSEGTGVGVIRHCQSRRADQSIVVMNNHARNDHLLHHCETLGVDALYHKATELDSLLAYCKSMAAAMPRCPAYEPGRPVACVPPVTRRNRPACQNSFHGHTLFGTPRPGFVWRRRL